MSSALIFAAAPLEPTPRLRRRLALLERPIVIAADQGAATALAFGFQPDVVVGDFDSLAVDTLEALQRSGVSIETHPRDKDQTDGQLAIERALQLQPDELLLLGFVGGPRFDQTLAAIALLTHLDIPTVLLDERNETRLLRGPSACEWTPEAGEIVSLVPFQVDAEVTTAGLRWPLRRETLRLGDTRGSSNEPVSNTVRVEIGSGALLVARHFAAWPLRYSRHGMGPINLRTPGPTPLPPTVREALAREMIAHRGADFAASLRACVDGLQWAFQTQHDIVILTASGTGGLESLAVNTLSPGQRLLAFTMGYFGDRMVRIARAFGADVVQVAVEAGQAVDPQLVFDRLSADPDAETVFVTHNETSTGVLNPLPEIARAVRQARPEALLMVDGISSIGSVPIQPEAWGCDVAVAGSQKGWMIPPGLTFVSVSERAWQRQKQSKLPKFYFDWQQARRAADDGGTPWTPAVNLFFALQAALALMRAEGLEALFARHARLAEYVRGGLADLGMRLLADPRYASPTVTTAFVPDGVDPTALLGALEERHGIVMAGGQGKLEGKIVRVGHMGWVSQADLAAVLQALQVELTSVRAPSGAR